MYRIYIGRGDRFSVYRGTVSAWKTVNESINSKNPMVYEGGTVSAWKKDSIQRSLWIFLSSVR